MNQFFGRYSTEIIASVLYFLISIISGYGAKSNDPSWYTSLIKASFTPPAWIFGPIWSILYLMIGFVLGKIWKVRQVYPWLLFIFVTQTILNLLWPWVFFHFHRPDLAFYNICLLWTTILIVMKTVYKTSQRSIIIWLIPYFLWTSFALVLNFTTAQLNHYL